MARDEKPLQLRPIDEDAGEPAPVIRLGEREGLLKKVDEKPVRLGPRPAASDQEPAADVSRRLALPDKDEFELRTHQPGIEVLIDPESVNPEHLEQSWGEGSSRRNPIPWGWFALIGLMIAAAVTWSVTRVQKADVAADQLRIATESALVDEKKEEREAEQLVERIEAALRSYFAATSVESLARLVRHPERVTPLMHQHYGGKPVSGGILKSVRMLQPLTLDNRGNFWMASVVLTQGGTRNLIIEISNEGEPRIDWETLVCHQPMPWDDFVRQRPAGSSMDFRIYVENDSFHSHEFSDSAQWTSYRLTALDSDETLFGFVRAGSDEERELAALLEAAGGRKSSLILRLVIPDGLQARRAAVIEKVVNNRWLYLDPPGPDS